MERLHNWTITEPQVSMFCDRLEILYHGELSRGCSEKEFFEGNNKPRNATLCKVFHMAGIEAPNVTTIVEKYGKGVFEISDNHIRITNSFPIYRTKR